MTKEDCLKWETINIFHTASVVNKDEFPKILTVLTSCIKGKKIKETKKGHIQIYDQGSFIDFDN